MDKGLKTALWIAIITSFIMTSFMIGFYWGNIQGSINTMNFCMLQNLTGYK